MNESFQIRDPLAKLAAYLACERDTILRAWGEAMDRDPEVSTSSTISRTQFNDHVPEILDAFERDLRGLEPDASIRAAEQQSDRKAPRSE